MRYPVAFGPTGDLIGMSAKREISLNEAYVYCPMRCIINASKFRKDPQVGHLIEKHPELFEERDNRDHLVVIFYLIHEMSKGRDSFWYHYFQVSALPDMPAKWT